MDKAERATGLRTLRFLCEGTRLEGLTFYGLRLLLLESEHNSKRIDGQIYINIESPHLLLTFETGEVLLIWGQHDQYESWQVVACLNNGLAIWGAEDIVRYT